jgi:hypothetical protein
MGIETSVLVDFYKNVGKSTIDGRKKKTFGKVWKIKVRKFYISVWQIHYWGAQNRSGGLEIAHML